MSLPQPAEARDTIEDPEAFWPALMREISTWEDVEESEADDPPMVF